MNTLLSVVREITSCGMIACVRAYQLLLSPLVALMGIRCRFVPTCSHYFIEAVKKYGPLQGGLKGILRVLRCHPFHPGGYDPP